jgi:hypothetical protein
MLKSREQALKQIRESIDYILLDNNLNGTSLAKDIVFSLTDVLEKKWIAEDKKVVAAHRDFLKFFSGGGVQIDREDAEAIYMLLSFIDSTKEDKKGGAEVRIFLFEEYRDRLNGTKDRIKTKLLSEGK